VLIALSFLTLVGPFLIARIPPVTDYPNHLARYWLIAGGAKDPALSVFYRIDWANAVTNVGADRMVSLLAPWFSALTIGHAAIIVAAIAPPLGVLTLNLAVFRRLNPWQAMFPLAAWSTTLLMGFVNFQLGLALALLFASIDELIPRRRWLTAGLARIPLGVVLMIDHPFGLIFYAILVAGLAMGAAPISPIDVRALGARLRRAALAASWCVIPIAIVTLWGHHALPGAQHAPTDVANPIRYLAYPGKFATLLSPLASYNIAQELVLAMTLAGLFTWLNRRRAFVVHGGLMLASAGLVFLSVAAPSHAAGASWIDRRFPIMALMCAFGALQARADLSRRVSVSIGATTFALTVLQSAWVAWNWRAMSQDMNAAIAVLQDVPAGARLLPMQHDPSLSLKWRAPAGRYMFGVGDATFRHYDSLAAPLRHAFSPKLFAAKGIQPLRILGDWDRLVEHSGGDLASVSALSRPPLVGEPAYVPGWRTRFDYVLVLNADMPDASGPFRPPAELTLVSSNRFAQLWRIAPLRSAAP
jgi:hypothetical protein